MRVLVLLRERSLPVDEIKAFNCYSIIADPKSGRRECGVELVTVGRMLHLLQGLAEDEVNWLVFQLNDHVAELRHGGVPGPAGVTDSGCEAPGQAGVVSYAEPPEVSGEPGFATPSHSAAMGVAAGDAGGSAAAVVRLSRGVAQARRPSDCTWERNDGFRVVSFSRRGRISIGQVLSLLFINAFWNGLVSVFGLFLWGGLHFDEAPSRAAWWGFFFFLLPFEVAGIMMLAALVAAVLEPLHRTVWRFYLYEIEARETWLGLGCRRAWPVDKLNRLEVRQDKPSRLQFRQASAPDDFFRRLWFIDQANRELCSIKRLTEGEAHWIGRLLQHERAAWFDRR